MSKKTRNLVITAVLVVLVVVGAVVAYQWYEESQKSPLQKTVEKGVKETEKAATTAIKETEKAATKAADETKKAIKQ